MMPTTRIRNRSGLLTGAAYAGLFGLGSAITLIDAPTFGGPPDAARNYFLDQSTEIYLGGILSILAVPCVLWFSGTLRTALEELVPARSDLARIASVGAAAAGAVTAVEVMALTAGAVRVRQSGDIGAESAALLYDISTAVGGVGIPCCLATTQIAISVIALRHRVVIPRPVALLTIPLAASACVVPIAPILLFPSLIWLAAISIRLFQSQGATTTG